MTVEREKAKIATKEELGDKYLKDSVSIYPETLEEELIRVPSDLAYWSAQYAKAVRAYLLADMTLDQVRARVRIEAREELLAAATPDPEDVTDKRRGPKRGTVTESMVDAKVEGSEEHADARLALIEAEAEKERLRGIVDAVKAKRDMLISLGAIQRVEMLGDPALRAEGRDLRRDRPR